jgi:hypothetical protein
MGDLTTSSLTPKATVAQPTPTKIDPVCVALRSKIDGLRKEGVVEALEKVSAGKTTTVSVKRASLAKITELEKANSEFQAKCSTLAPTPQQAQAAPSPSPVASAQAAPAPTAAVVATATGTSAPAVQKAAAAAAKVAEGVPQVP